jgi:PAS domain S-box-containing protein
MTDNTGKRSLRKRLLWQFTAFVAVIMALVTVVVSFLLRTTLTRDLKISLSADAYHSLKNVEQRVSFLAESIRNFSENHFVINSLIDPQGRSLYLPRLVQDFSETQDVSAVTVVDFEGNVVYSGLANPPDYRRKTFLRATLALGESAIHLSGNPKNIVLAEPIEYYQTPQGAVIVEINLASIVSRALPKEEFFFHKLYANESALFSQHVKEDESYITVREEAGNEFTYMSRLKIGLETAALKAVYLAPVRDAVRQLILIGVLFTLFAVIIAAKIGDSIARPVLQLCEKVRRTEVFENEKCSPTGTGDELEELARVFDNRTEQLVSARKGLEKHAEDVRNTNLRLQQEIAERNQAEEALRQSEMNLASAQEVAHIGSWSRSLKTNEVQWSREMFRLFGLKPGIPEHLTFEIFLSRVHPEDVESVKSTLNTIVEKKRTFEFEFRTVPIDGSVRVIRACGEVICDEEGEPIRLFGTDQDITKIRLAEEEKKTIEAQLQQAKRLEAIGTLAGGIAHNFNNLLMAIQGNASLMLLETDSTRPDYERLKNIEKMVQSGSKLTSQLLGYARAGNYEVKPISLNRLVEETSNAFAMAKKEHRVHRELAEGICGIKADQGQIEQILLNLYVNAADAMPGGGDLFLKTRNITHKELNSKPYNVKPGRYVSLTVTDTGVGMDKETMEHIFEPFFTTKGLAKGTGLGLASVYGIVKAHGGYIDVDSEKARGTIFNICFPASDSEAMEETESPGEVLRGKETILLVDDEDMILDVGQAFLKRLGYKVWIARGGKEAVRTYEENKAQIDLVILDHSGHDHAGQGRG